MKQNNRLLLYLLINIIVSAVTTFSVLLFWEWIHQIQTPPIFITSPTASPANAVEALPAAGENTLEIENVFGVGRLQDEMVVIKHVGESELSLAGWKLVDEQNHEYVFPRITLTQGEINVYTQAGIDSAKDLHWGQNQSVWKFGGKVRIYDPLGTLRAEYTIP